MASLLIDPGRKAEIFFIVYRNIKISAERLSASGVIGTLASQEFDHNGNTYTEYLLTWRLALVQGAAIDRMLTAG